MSEPAVRARGVAHSYGERRALCGIDFEVARGAAHGFLGPNGSGKSTLFKILATILPLREGSVTVLGRDLRADPAALRPRLGVVFQSPAVDKKLTVRENLRHGGHLYGLRGADLEKRIDHVLERGNLTGRQRDRVEVLSGGLRRRVEVAKGLLHGPELVLLDEASTGLDPGARLDLWAFLRGMEGVTVLFTTHLMDEAAQADRLTLLHQGEVVAEGTPQELMQEVGEQVLELTGDDPEGLARELGEALQVKATVLQGAVRIEDGDVTRLVQPVMERFGDRVQRLTLSPPSLEDVFIRKTGHRLREDVAGPEGED